MAWFKKEESGSLNDFRETLKNVLEEITTLEINTMIVDKISTEKFDVKDFVKKVEEAKEKTASQSSGSLSSKEEAKSELKKLYEKLYIKISEFDNKNKNENSPEKTQKNDAQKIRYFRKLWELEQSLINDDRVYAQTKLSLDGDLTNRFVRSLFKTTESGVEPEFDPKTSALILSLHRQGVVNAENQWSGLIKTCVELVKSLISFRK